MSEVNKDLGKNETFSTSKKFKFFDVGFHGDHYLLQLVKFITGNCNCFIETGTNVGSTLAYVAKNFPSIHCLSCEPCEESFERAVENTSNLLNVSIYKETSQEFIKRLKRKKNYLLNKNIIFWLDAHGYGFEWPLKEELHFITTELESAYILIDDFKVPHLDCFGYDQYQGQICSFDYVKDAINPNLEYRLYYPDYTEKTSKHHPLQGWGLIEFGQGKDLELPEALRNKIRQVNKVRQVNKKTGSGNGTYGRMAIRDRFDDLKEKIKTDSPIIVDGGAHKGSMTRLFLTQYNAPTIHAFEPIPELFNNLTERYASNNNVVLHNNALGAETRDANFNVLNYLPSSSILTPSLLKKSYHGSKVDVKETIKIQQVRLDDILNGVEIDILKLDLQGYELEALKGCGNLLKNIKAIVTEVEFISLYDNQPLFADIDIFLRKYGFELLNLYELYTQPEGQLTSGDAVYLNKCYFSL